MDATTTDKQPLYHVLYADEVRLDSLDAQINKRVPVRFIQGAGASTGNTTSGEAGVPSIAKGVVQASETKSTSTSTEYSFRDARYFSVLESVGIDLRTPEYSLPLNLDGEIHAFRGRLQVASLSSSKPLLDTIKLFCSVMSIEALNKNLSPKDVKEKRKDLDSVQKMVDFGLKMPAPPSFLLSMLDNKKIYGPVIENAVRLPLSDQAMVFGASLPFEWIVVGYLFPNEKHSSNDDAEQGFLFSMTGPLEEMRHNIIPQADAIMIPLLILR